MVKEVLFALALYAVSRSLTVVPYRQARSDRNGAMHGIFSTAWRSLKFVATPQAKVAARTVDTVGSMEESEVLLWATTPMYSNSTKCITR